MLTYLILMIIMKSISTFIMNEDNPFSKYFEK